MKRWFSRHWLVFLVLAVALTLYQLLGLGCPFRALLGFPCPSCGMTRALEALLRLDPATSLSMHPLMLPTFATVLLSLHRSLFPARWQRVLDWLAVVVAVAVVALWLVRLSNGWVG